jgi:small subunit ribosomal protein S20
MRLSYELVDRYKGEVTMPQIKSAYKRLRQDKKKHVHNKAKISAIRTLAKKTDTLIAEKKKDEAEESMRQLESKLCKAAKTNTVKKESAARKVSRMKKKLSKV